MFFILKILLSFILIYVILFLCVFLCVNLSLKVAKKIKIFRSKLEYEKEQNNIKFKKNKPKKLQKKFNQSLGVWEIEE